MRTAIDIGTITNHHQHVTSSAPADSNTNCLHMTGSMIETKCRKHTVSRILFCLSCLWFLGWVHGGSVNTGGESVNPKSHADCVRLRSERKRLISCMQTGTKMLSVFFSVPWVFAESGSTQCHGSFCYLGLKFEICEFFGRLYRPRCRLRGQLDDSGWRCKLGCTRG